jgi:hypothetical protein
MSHTTLKEDLLAEFREERVMITEQIELLDPLATSLRQPAATNLLSSSTLVITEYICYFLSAGSIAFLFLMHRIFPFSLLSNFFYNPDFRNQIGSANILYFMGAIYGIIVLGALLVFLIGRVVREVRLKNEILEVAGRDIKLIVGMHLQRKAAIDTLEQRHMLGMSGIAMPNKSNNSVG